MAAQPAVIRLPPFQAMPVAVITDETDPDRAEIATFRTAILNWSTTVLAHLSVLNPTHGFAEVLPNAPAANAAADVRIARLTEMRTYITWLFSIYATGYAAFATALVGQAAAPPVAHAVRGPKTKLPDTFQGKSSAAARHFIAQCTNYAALNPFLNPEHQIRWALQLMDGDASMWRNVQFALFDVHPVPVHLQNWPDFEDEFRTRWTDPYEAEKAMDKILKGVVSQTTSVTVYNNQFNELLGLTGLDGANPAIVRAYIYGLKPAVRTAAVGPLLAQPNMGFATRQALMARVDDGLMQARTEQGSTPMPRRNPQNISVIPNPPPSTTPTPAPVGRASSTPVPHGQTHIKVEAARQFTRLTSEERENLRRTGGCFRCRQPGHMASQCPRQPQASEI
jgi:hypothetical protein